MPSLISHIDSMQEDSSLQLYVLQHQNVMVLCELKGKCIRVSMLIIRSLPNDVIDLYCRLVADVYATTRNLTFIDTVEMVPIWGWGMDIFKQSSAISRSIFLSPSSSGFDQLSYKKVPWAQSAQRAQGVGRNDCLQCIRSDASQVWKVVYEWDGGF